MAVRNAKPKFGFAELWGACSRCNARVRYSTLVRERLTGLMVCGPSSGRPVRYCLDPWPPFYDFQVYPDKSIEPPPEPLPLRYNLDAIWGNGPKSGPTATFAAAPAAAPDDATRLARLLSTVPYYAQQGPSAAFISRGNTPGAEIFNATTIIPADYDGTFIPSGSIRTVTPPDEGTELAEVNNPSPSALVKVVGDHYVIDGHVLTQFGTPQSVAALKTSGYTCIAALARKGGYFVLFYNPNGAVNGSPAIYSMWTTDSQAAYIDFTVANLLTDIQMPPEFQFIAGPIVSYPWNVAKGV